MTKKVTQARKGLGTNSVGLATELSLVSKLLQKVIPKKISAVLYFTYIPYTHIQHKDYTYKALKRYKRLNAAIQKYT